MSLLIENHGGCCCGIGHIYGFYHLVDFTPEQTVRHLGHKVEEVESLLYDREDEDREDFLEEFGPSYAKEVVLTDAQLEMYKDIKKALKDCGFVRVARWKNPNTDNMCNMFISSSTLKTDNLDY